jgi:quinol---cytochrome c reductase iron-sulfur subunit, bacillus type
MEPQDVTETGPGVQERRRFLKVFIGLFSSLVAAALAIPFLGAVIGGSSRTKKRSFSKVAAVDSLPLGRPVDVVYAETSSDAYIRQEAVHHLWVVKRSDSDVVVFSPICPHLGCGFAWDPRDSLFKCPCHGSVFTIDGRVVAGPAPRGLDTLPAEVRGGALYVQWEQFRVGTSQKTPA